MTQQSPKIFEKLFSWHASSSYRHPWRLLTIALLTLIPSIYLVKDLRIESDFKKLLPQNKPSVIALNRIVEKIGGVGNLIVLIEGDDPKTIQKGVEAVAAELKKLPHPYVRYLETNIDDIKGFYKDQKYLYLAFDDLQDIHGRLKRKIKHEKLMQNPFYFSLDDEEVKFDVSDIEEKYESKEDKYAHYLDGYFFSKDQRFAAIVLQPAGSTTGTGFAKELITKVEGAISRANLKSVDPSLKSHIHGKYKRVLEEYDQLIKDVLSTLTLCLFLVALIIYLYFLRIRSILLLTAVLAFGSIWTFSLTQWQIGYLNSQTAFLGSIIIGNGVNSGIFLLARYLEERRHGADLLLSMQTALTRTYAPTFAAAITTSSAFAALATSEIKGFSHFGFIGGIGMMLCWIATYGLLPSLVFISEKVSPLIKAKRNPGQWNFIFQPLGRLVSSRYQAIRLLAVSLTCLSGVLAWTFLPTALEYDFSKLQNKKPQYNEDRLDVGKVVRDIFKQGTSPAVILLSSPDQAKYICDAVLSAESHIPDWHRTIDTCQTLQAYLPDQQKDKLKELAQLRETLNDSSLNFLSKEQRKELEDFKNAVNLSELDIAQLPESIQRNYREKDGVLGRIVYVYPRKHANLNNGKRLMQFSDALSNLELADGSKARMSGESAIFADLLRAVMHDGPKSTLLSLLFVSILVFLNFRRFRPLGYVLTGLLMGVTIMLGMQAILDIKLNFFNFIALPVTFGIGVDYGVNFWQRYREKKAGGMSEVLSSIGGAIALCSMTTLIGYSTLVTATNQALASFGWLALIGEMACLITGLVLMPAFLAKRQEQKSSNLLQASDPPEALPLRKA